MMLRINGNAPALTQNTGARPVGRSFDITATAIDSAKKIKDTTNSNASNSVTSFLYNECRLCVTRSRHSLLSSAAYLTVYQGCGQPKVSGLVVVKPIS